MKKQSIIFSIIFLSLSLSALAENDFTPDAVSLSYYGELITHPGMEVSAEYTLFERGPNLLFSDLRAGGYRHYLNHISLFTGAELGYRLYLGNVFQLQTRLGVNYLHKWVDGAIYSVSDKGELNEIANFGSSHLMPSVSAGWGISPFRNKALTIFSQAELFGEYPFNTFILPHAVISLGVRKQL